MPADERLGELARAILDHHSVDWPRSEPGLDQSAREVVAELKVIAAVASLQNDTPVPSRGPEPPASWGSLRLLEKVGEGAFGEVFRAWDTRLGREVALKLLPVANGSSIIDEGQSLARVRHPNVAAIHGAERIDGYMGLWMEFVRGCTMEQLIVDAPLDGARAARIGVDICRAVSAVHAAGLLHRDIKTQNVMLSGDGRVVLMDFGTVRALADDSSTDLAGTPLYQAPEIFQGHAATVQSDIYSLGVLLYRLVSRAYPVQAATAAELRRAHQRGASMTLHAVRPDLPVAYARVVARATSPVPEGRYQTAAGLAADLAAVNGRTVRPRGSPQTSRVSPSS